MQHHLSIVLPRSVRAYLAVAGSGEISTKIGLTHLSNKSLKGDGEAAP